jgi:hypothetical protein
MNHSFPRLTTTRLAAWHRVAPGIRSASSEGRFARDRTPQKTRADPQVRDQVMIDVAGEAAAGSERPFGCPASR